MINEELKKYITQRQALGITEIQIRQELATQGWSSSDLDEIFKPTKDIIPRNPYAKALSILSSFYVIASLVAIPLVGIIIFFIFFFMMNFIVIPLPLFIPAASDASCLSCSSMVGTYLLALIALPLGLLGVYGAKQLAKGNKIGKYIWIFLIIISFATCIYNFIDYYYLHTNDTYYSYGFSNRLLPFTSALMAIVYLILFIGATRKKTTQTSLKSFTLSS